MAIVLSIETSTNVCSAAIHKNDSLLANQTHRVENSHSSLLPNIASEVLEASNLDWGELDAIAVSAGPGSYTGLRIGAATAKGFCFGHNIPLVSISTLEIMIEAVREKFNGDHYLCPMIDARRMEVYTQMIDQDDNLVWEPQAKILDDSSFSEFDNSIYLFGNGMPKFKEIADQNNLIFIDDIFPDAMNMGRIATEKLEKGDVEDVAYFEPNYLKEWRTTTPKKQLL